MQAVHMKQRQLGKGTSNPTKGKSTMPTRLKDNIVGQAHKVKRWEKHPLVTCDFSTSSFDPRFQ